MIHNKLLLAQPEWFNTVSQPAIEHGLGYAPSISCPGIYRLNVHLKVIFKSPSWSSKWTTFNIFVHTNSVCNVIL
jgi:hypothetical protein